MSHRSHWENSNCVSKLFIYPQNRELFPVTHLHESSYNSSGMTKFLYTGCACQAMFGSLVVHFRSVSGTLATPNFFKPLDTRIQSFLALRISVHRNCIFCNLQHRAEYTHGNPAWGLRKISLEFREDVLCTSIDYWFMLPQPPFSQRLIASTMVQCTGTRGIHLHFWFTGRRGHCHCITGCYNCY